MSARRYMPDHGATREQIAAVAVKNHAHSVHNPYAQYQRPISLEDVLGARIIAEPLGLLDCSPISDGAAAVVLCSRGRAAPTRCPTRPAHRRRAPWSAASPVTAATSINDEDVSRRAGEQAWELSGYGPDDIDLVEMHDCFTIAEIVRLEGLGLVPVRPGRTMDRERRHLHRRQAPGQPQRRPAQPRPPGRCHRRRPNLRAHLATRATEPARGRSTNANIGLAYCKGGTVSGTDGGSVTTLVVTR